MTDIQKLNFSVSVTQTIFECQKDKNMTRVKNKVINVKAVLEFIT
jgi:hypothetical protein